MQTSRSIFLSLSLAVLMASHTGMTRAEETPSLQDRVKAAFIFNFLQFTEWPAATFKATNDSFVVGILGDSLLADTLETAVVGKAIGGRQIALRRFQSVADVHDCQVLLVDDKFRDATETLRHRDDSILTIGDFEGFTDAGGIIRFFVEEKRERFEINTAAAERAHLVISSKLLKLAKIVRK